MAGNGLLGFHVATCVDSDIGGLSEKKRRMMGMYNKAMPS
jgi:hypothetical protein